MDTVLVASLVAIAEAAYLFKVTRNEPRYEDRMVTNRHLRDTADGPAAEIEAFEGLLAKGNRNFAERIASDPEPRDRWRKCGQRRPRPARSASSTRPRSGAS